MSAALALEPPCYGHDEPNRYETEHVWIEWANGELDTRKAQALGEYIEAAWQTYIDLGWPMPDEPIAYLVSPPFGGDASISGLTRTELCGERYVPRVDLFLGFWEEAAIENLAAHELGHVAEYGYISPYLDATGTWMWWLEATATWLALHHDGDETSWAQETRGYLDQPQVGLHQPVSALLDPVASSHLYGGTIFVRFLESNYGGPDLIRQMWEWGSSRGGTPVSLFEALEGVGLDARSVWAHWLASAPTVDLGVKNQIDEGLLLSDTVQRLPATGQPDDALQPEGFGLSAVRFRAKAFGNDALQVTFRGDPTIDWMVVLVRIDGKNRKANVLDYTPLEVIEGQAEGWVSGLSGSEDAYLVASPLDLALVQRGWTWQAERIDDPGPMDDNVVIGEAVAGGCSCDQGGRAGWLALPLLLLGLRRRR